MTDFNGSGLCIRCGKQRVVVKEWEEVETTAGGSSTLYFSQYDCPDPECQKEVEVELLKRRALADEREARFEEKQAARMRGNSRGKQATTTN